MVKYRVVSFELARKVPKRQHALENQHRGSLTADKMRLFVCNLLSSWDAPPKGNRTHRRLSPSYLVVCYRLLPSVCRLCLKSHARAVCCHTRRAGKEARIPRGIKCLPCEVTPAAIPANFSGTVAKQRVCPPINGSSSFGLD